MICLYNKACNSGLQEDWAAYKDMKRQNQQQHRNAHNKYVSDMLDEILTVQDTELVTSGVPQGTVLGPLLCYF